MEESPGQRTPFRFTRPSDYLRAHFAAREAHALRPAKCAHTTMGPTKPVASVTLAPQNPDPPQLPALPPGTPKPMFDDELLTRRLVAAYCDPTLSIPQGAAACGLSITDLIPWLDHPHTKATLAELTRQAEERCAELLASIG